MRLTKPQDFESSKASIGESQTRYYLHLPVWTSKQANIVPTRFILDDMLC